MPTGRFPHDSKRFSTTMTADKSVRPTSFKGSHIMLGHRRSRFHFGTFASLCVLAAIVAPPRGTAADKTATKFVDHSLLIAPEYPCTWPTAPFPRFQLTHQRVI